MKINLIKHYQVLLPSLPQDAELLEGIGFGEILEVEIKRPRNGKFHRKFFALLQVVKESTDYDNVEQILLLLKLKLGHYETIVNTNGKPIYYPKSISFAKMEQPEFEQFYSQSVNVILRDFVPNWTQQDIEQAVDRIIRF